MRDRKFNRLVYKRAEKYFANFNIDVERYYYKRDAQEAADVIKNKYHGGTVVRPVRHTNGFWAVQVQRNDQHQLWALLGTHDTIIVETISEAPAKGFAQRKAARQRT